MDCDVKKKAESKRRLTPKFLRYLRGCGKKYSVSAGDTIGSDARGIKKIKMYCDGMRYDPPAVAAVDAPVKKKRGRPKKVAAVATGPTHVIPSVKKPTAPAPQAPPAAAPAVAPSGQNAVPRKRGRPKKDATKSAAAPAAKPGSPRHVLPSKADGLAAKKVVSAVNKAKPSAFRAS